MGTCKYNLGCGHRKWLLANIALVADIEKWVLANITLVADIESGYLQI